MGYGLGTDIGGLVGSPDASAPLAGQDAGTAPGAPTAQYNAPQAAPQAFSPPPGGYMSADSVGNPVPVDSAGQAVNPGSNLPTSNVPLPPPRPADLGVGQPMQLGPMVGAPNVSAPQISPGNEGPGLPFMGANGLNLNKVFTGVGKIATSAGGGSIGAPSGGAGSGARSFAQSGANEAVKNPQTQNSAPSAPIGQPNAAPWMVLLNNMLFGRNTPISTGQVGQKPPGTTGTLL
jgi:hypothetical protein